MTQIRSHLPVNHPARPMLRLLAGAIGCFILAFGILGLVQTWGLPFFDRGDNWALGLRTNPAFSALSVLAGAVLLGGAVYGRNIDHLINLGGGVLFLLSGLFMMTLLHTEANLLNFSMTNCTVSFLIGMALLWAGLYGRTGPPELAEAEEELRKGPQTSPGHEDPREHGEPGHEESGSREAAEPAEPEPEQRRGGPAGS